MDKEIKDQWLEALRSGDYVQGYTYLEYGGRYCCLGVLCELAVKAGVIEVIESKLEGNGTIYGYANDTATLPEKVVEWANLPDANPVVGDQGQFHRTLSQINDHRNHDFNAIATLIEKHL
jgi:hypothetical protein